MEEALIIAFKHAGDLGAGRTARNNKNCWRAAHSAANAARLKKTFENRRILCVVSVRSVRGCILC